MLATNAMRKSCRAGLVAGAVLMCLGSAFAEDSATPAKQPNSPGVEVAPGTPSPQTSSDAPRDVPDLALTTSQKQAVYQSVHNQKVLKSTEPIGFRAAVGAHVPGSIAVAPLPPTVVDLAPSLKGYEYAFVANQVLIVQPETKTVVDVIAE
jgi:hypothetical protein